MINISKNTKKQEVIIQDKADVKPTFEARFEVEGANEKRLTKLFHTESERNAYIEGVYNAFEYAGLKVKIISS